jgi:AraC-like DNA-binding protein
MVALRCGRITIPAVNRKKPKPEWRGYRWHQGVEYRSDPSVLAQSFWYYVLCLGMSRPPCGFVHQHEHEPTFLLHYIRGGEMWHIIAERSYRVQAGSVCLMYLQRPARYGVDGDATAENWWILFNGRDLPGLFLALGADQDPVFALPDVSRFEQLFRELMSLARRRPPAYQARSFGILALMLAELFAARGKADEKQLDLVSSRRPRTQFSEPVLNAIRSIGRFYNDAITLASICDATNLSVHHFVRVFHRETGMSPMRYLTRYRIEKAKELLHTTSHPVGEIARLVGIPDQYTFARTFRRLVGRSPTQFRAATDHPEN